MSKVLNVRLEDRDFEGIETRDRARFPTQSDYVREALRRMRREERRARVRLEAKRLAEDPAEMAMLRDLANARLDGVIELWGQPQAAEH